MDDILGPEQQTGPANGGPELSVGTGSTRHSVDLVAQRLGISPRAVRKRLQSGALAGEFDGRRWWVLLVNDVGPSGPEPTSGTQDRSAEPVAPRWDQIGPELGTGPLVTAAARSQLEAIRDEWLAPLVAQITEQAVPIARLGMERDAARQQATVAEAECDRLQARVTELETKPAAQLMGELAMRPAFAPITPTPVTVDTAALEAEQDALRSRVRALEAKNAAPRPAWHQPCLSGNHDVLGGASGRRDEPDDTTEDTS